MHDVPRWHHQNIWNFSQKWITLKSKQDLDKRPEAFDITAVQRILEP